MRADARIRAGVCAGLALVAPSCGSGGGPGGTTQEFDRDSYHTGDELVRLRVYRDQIGVVLDEDATVSELRAILHEGTVHMAPKNRALGGLLGTLHLLDPLGEPDRDGLKAIASSYQHDASEVVEHAGIVVRPEGSDVPMLLTHEFIVHFEGAATEQQIADLLTRHGVEEIERSDYVPQQRLLITPPTSDTDALEACRLFAAEPLVEFCEPNFVHHVEYLARDLDDPLLGRQWHHENTGQGGGTPDADLDTPLAWDFTTGKGVVIAVLENGFDVDHPDLRFNLWSNPANPSIHGWNFEDDDSTLEGDPLDRGATSHGTAVAGCAAARGDNGIGVAGTCPECDLMLLRRPNPPNVFADAQAIHYAWANGADIITNSWTYPERQPVPRTIRHALDVAMKTGRGGKGCVVLFAVRNTNMNVDSVYDVAALEGLLSVGAVTNTDQRTLSCGWGKCLDVLGPSRLSQTRNVTEGTLNITTTDWRGIEAGYNHEPAMQVEMDEGWDPCEDLGGNGDRGNYTACFGGTSAATPIVAGVVGLLLSVAPDLTREQVIHILRNTTDRMEDDRANYSDRTGLSAESSHGHGRVNAFEAVRLVAPGPKGRGGIDLYVRDNRLDWGNTEQPSYVNFKRKREVIGSWESSDVKIDAKPFVDPPTTSVAFDHLVTEEPIAGEAHRVYVRVRNRGTKVARQVRVYLYEAAAGTSMPPLPEGFRDGDDLGDVLWKRLGSRPIHAIEHCGASIAGSKADGGQIVSFDFVAPVAQADGPSRHSFLAVVECDQDTVEAGGPAAPTDPITLVAKDNNVTYRNVHAWSGSGGSTAIYVRNASDEGIQTRLEAFAPKGTKVLVESESGVDRLGEFALGAGERLLVRVKVTGTAPTEPFGLRQWRLVEGGPPELMGGITFEPVP